MSLAPVIQLRPATHIGEVAALPLVTPRRQQHSTLALLAAAVVVSALLLAVLGWGVTRFLAIGDDTSPDSRLGIIAVCVWRGAPNPEGLPVCSEAP